MTEPRHILRAELDLEAAHTKPTIRFALNDVEAQSYPFSFPIRLPMREVRLGQVLSMIRKL